MDKGLCEPGIGRQERRAGWRRRDMHDSGVVRTKIAKRDCHAVIVRLVSMRRVIDLAAVWVDDRMLALRIENV